MRPTLDKLISWLGLALAAVLLVAGGLMAWASTFVGNQVSSQLADQKITMPAGPAIEDPLIKPYLEKYAGQQMTNGDQAEAFANHYIKVHMDKASGGKTYQEVSGDYLKLVADTSAAPADVTKAAELRQTMFMGDSLRGLLLNAYAFGTMGKIAGYGAVAAVIGAAALAVLSFLGFRHAKTTA